MELLNVIVEVEGIKSRKELNGQLGLATAYDDSKGRVAVRLISQAGQPRTHNQLVSLKVDNLSDWAAAKRRDVATLKISKDDIDAVRSPKELVGFLRAGAALSQEPGIAEAIYEKALNPPGGTKFVCAVRLELLRAGVVEMLVQSMDAHMADRTRCFFALFCVSQLFLVGQTHEEFCFASEAKDRAVAAGYFERLCTALRAQTTSDCQSNAVSGFMQVASGGAFVGTEARREAAAKAGGLEAVIAAMKLAPHRSVVQHFGIGALNAIVALGCAPGVKPNTSRCDIAIRAGAPQLAIEAMSRFAHLHSDAKGLCVHTMEYAKGGEADCYVPGSILQSGCEFLHALVCDCNKERIAALNAAGSLQAVAAAVRANPSCVDSGSPEGAFDQFGPEASLSLSDAHIIEPLVITLVDDKKLTEVMDADTMMTLVGTNEQPGFLLLKEYGVKYCQYWVSTGQL